MNPLLLDAREPSDRVYEVGGEQRPLAKVPLKTSFAVRTLDASGNQITPEVETQQELDTAALFPATGPIEVPTVQAGDGVGIEVMSIHPVTTGHLWTRPGLGFGPAPGFHVRAVDTQELILEVGEHRLPLRSRLHVGTLGVSPSNAVAARDVGDYGGNIDFVALRPGATLWVTAQQEGAGIFAADVHAAIGDAEICGTGVEVEAQLQLRVHQHGWAPNLPVVIDDGRVWAIGVGDDLEEALDRSVRFLHSGVMEALQLDSADAYLAVSALLEVKVCQVVNPHSSVAVSLRSGLDRYLVPAELLGPTGDRSTSVG